MVKVSNKFSKWRKYFQAFLNAAEVLVSWLVYCVKKISKTGQLTAGKSHFEYYTTIWSCAEFQTTQLGFELITHFWHTYVSILLSIVIVK